MLLNEMEIFYYVVELKSFSKAADRLGKSKSFISKKITELEHELKLRLLSRSTRQLILTEAGENFYLVCAKVVDEGKKVFSTLQELQTEPTGTLKISMPPALGLNLISKMLPKFLQQFPKIHFDIQLESRIVDLIQEGYDLILRSAKLESSNLIAQRIMTSHGIIVGTKKYFKHYGIPKKPSDLKKQNFAVYSGTKNSHQIKLSKKGQQEIINVSSNFSSNQMDLIKQMILNDSCIGALPEFMIATELQQKKLIPCLTDYQLPTHFIYAIYPEREFMPAKLKVFLDRLKKYLEII